MSYAYKKFYCTNTNDESGNVLLSAWMPERRDGLYYMPKNTPLGGDMWIPNILNLKPNESVEVEIVKSDIETGIWIICYDGDFLEEQHIYNYKPKFIDGTKNLDYNYADEQDDFGICVYTNMKIKKGDIFSVTLKKKE